jgi:hypothetical protein
MYGWLAPVIELFIPPDVVEEEKFRDVLKKSIFHGVLG